MSKPKRRRHWMIVRPRERTPEKRTPKFLLDPKRIPTPLPFIKARDTVERAAPRQHHRVLTSLRFLFFILGHVLLNRIRRLFTRKRVGIDAIRLRLSMQRMGGVWVKAGQLIAMRRDIFSREVCDELGRLHDSADGFSGALAKQIIEEELKQPIHEVFSELDEKPLAAASIGQVHAGRLKEYNVRVVVKVRRPYIVDQFGADLRIVRKIVWLLHRIVPHARWYDMLWELEKALSEELDYRREGASLKEMRRKLADHNVHVPRAFLMYTTERVLVMEFVEGVFMSDYIRVSESHPEVLETWLDENNIDPVLLGKRLYCSLMRQAFEDNRFHCDLHPGNIMLLRDSRFALIDFGSTGSFDVSLLLRYHKLFEAMTEKNYERVAELYLMLGPDLPHISVDEVKTTLVHVLRDWDARTNIKKLPYHDKSLTSVFNDIGGILTKYNVPPTWEAIRFNRALYTLDASLMYLMPRVSYSVLGRRYWRGFQRRAVRSMFQGLPLSVRLYGIKTMLDIPRQLGDNLYFQGQTLRHNAVLFQGRVTNAAYVAQQLFSWMMRMLLLAGGLAIVRVIHDNGHRMGWWSPEHCVFHAVEHETMRYGFAGDVAAFILIGVISLLRLLWKLRRRMSEVVPDLLVNRR